MGERSTGIVQVMREIGKVAVLVTQGVKEEAHSTAVHAVRLRKAACVSIAPQAGSLFLCQAKLGSG